MLLGLFKVWANSVKKTEQLCCVLHVIALIQCPFLRLVIVLYRLTHHVQDIFVIGAHLLCNSIHKFLDELPITEWPTAGCSSATWKLDDGFGVQMYSAKLKVHFLALTLCLLSFGLASSLVFVSGLNQLFSLPTFKPFFCLFEFSCWHAQVLQISITRWSRWNVNLNVPFCWWVKLTHL